MIIDPPGLGEPIALWKAHLADLLSLTVPAIHAQEVADAIAKAQNEIERQEREGSIA